MNDEEEEENGRIGFLDLPDIPIGMILKMIHFQDRKRLRLVSNRMKNCVSKFVPAFTELNINLDGERLPQFNASINMDLNLDLREFCKKGSSNDSSIEVCSWITTFRNRVISIKGVNAYIFSIISEVDFPRLTQLELECNDGCEAGYINKLPAFITSHSGTLTSLALFRVPMKDLPPLTSLKLHFLSFLHIYASRYFNQEDSRWLNQLLSCCTDTLETLIMYQVYSFDVDSNIDLSGVKDLRVSCVSSGKTLSSLIATFSKSLQHLRLESVNLEDFDVDIKCLESLEVKYSSYSVGIIRLMVQSAPSLTSLSLIHCRDFSFAGLKCSGIRFERLREISIVGEFVSFDFLVAPELDFLVSVCHKSLQVLHLQQVDISCFQNMEVDLPALSKLIVPCSSKSGLNTLLTKCSPALKTLVLLYDRNNPVPEVDLPPNHDLAVRHLQIIGLHNTYNWGLQSSLDLLLMAFKSSLEILELNNWRVRVNNWKQFSKMICDLPRLGSLAVCPQLPEAIYDTIRQNSQNHINIATKSSNLL